MRERALERKKNRKNMGEPVYKPTQEELLEEAKLTEQENLKSLGNHLNRIRLCKTVLIIVKVQ